MPSPYLGDITLGDTLDLKFSTVGTTGAPTTLAGTPAISAYVGLDVGARITAGITLSVDFDGVTGRRRPSGIFLFGQMGHRDPRY